MATPLVSRLASLPLCSVFKLWACSFLQAIRTASAGLGGLDGVTTFCEMAVPLVSRLAEALGLPGNTPEAVDAGRDKYATRECLAKAGLPTPRNARIRAPGDVQPAGEYVGFPSVIKPVSGVCSYVWGWVGAGVGTIW